MTIMTTRSRRDDTAALAASITRAASRQTYYTIRFLADRDRVDDAYRAYAYFRWLDDELDSAEGSNAGSSDFVSRQRSLLESLYDGAQVRAADGHEQLLVDLVQRSGADHGGLKIYLRNMMEVMAFDAARRGRVISQAELNRYTWHLASAVTEALHYFIGRDCSAPQDHTRYLAVSAAHITHMLRDTFDDLRAGYYNIPHEVLAWGRISPADIGSEAYRAWVRERVQLARAYFDEASGCLHRVKNLRCRLACLAYMGRFTGILDAIERDDFLLRPAYPETKGLTALLRAAFGLLAGSPERRRRGRGPGRTYSQERTLE